MLSSCLIERRLGQPKHSCTKVAERLTCHLSIQSSKAMNLARRLCLANMTRVNDRLFAELAQISQLRLRLSGIKYVSNNHEFVPAFLLVLPMLVRLSCCVRDYMASS